MAATMERPKRRRQTPLEQTRNIHGTPDCPRVDGPVERPIHFYDTLPPGMVRNNEILTAYATAYLFERWLCLHCAAHGIPMDNVLRAVELLVVWVEAELVARASDPDAYQWVEDEEPLDIADAIEHGLTIVPAPVERTRTNCILPGCQGGIISGVPCVELRAYGARFCPACAKRYLRSMRGE